MQMEPMSSMETKLWLPSYALYMEVPCLFFPPHVQHQRISEFPSSAFYSDELTTAESVMQRGPDPIYNIWPNNGETPRVFCHVDGREDRLSVKSEEGNEGSMSNGAEIGYVVWTN